MGASDNLYAGVAGFADSLKDILMMKFKMDLEKQSKKDLLAEDQAIWEKRLPMESNEKIRVATETPYTAWNPKTQTLDTFKGGKPFNLSQPPVVRPQGLGSKIDVPLSQTESDSLYEMFGIPPQGQPILTPRTAELKARALGLNYRANADEIRTELNLGKDPIYGTPTEETKQKVRELQKRRTYKNDPLKDLFE